MHAKVYPRVGIIQMMLRDELVLEYTNTLLLVYIWTHIQQIAEGELSTN